MSGPVQKSTARTTAFGKSPHRAFTAGAFPAIRTEKNLRTPCRRFLKTAGDGEALSLPSAVLINYVNLYMNNSQSFLTEQAFLRASAAVEVMTLLTPLAD